MADVMSFSSLAKTRVVFYKFLNYDENKKTLLMLLTLKTVDMKKFLNHNWVSENYYSPEDPATFSSLGLRFYLYRAQFNCNWCSSAQPIHWYISVHRCRLEVVCCRCGFIYTSGDSFKLLVRTDLVRNRLKY